MTEDRWQRLSALLDELLDLEPARRAARLAELAREDALLAEELTRLLAADERSGLLDAGVAHAAPTVMSRLAQGDAAAAGMRCDAGRQIGRYRLLERVGSGGMGEVWRAERINDFEQSVAIKLIRPLLDSHQLRERFARERRILARLDHPNIARLLDGGVSDDGTPWYAMEFVRGTDLIAYAQDKALGVRARVALLLQVCDAVAHAHTQLVVHRDLKPSNVLVDAEGRARVLDFGIARLLDDTADSQLTGTGVRVFSPAYAAPEQIRGEMVGTSADVFALGAVLYELLTGQVPHPQRTASPDKLIAGIEDEIAPRPSQAQRQTDGAVGRTSSRVSHHTGALDSDLDTIVATALQPDPTRRYAGAAQLADDLRRWLDGRPIAAQPDTAGYRMRKFVARHRVAVGSASAVLLALIGGLGLALWQANIAREHAERAEAERARAEAALQAGTESADRTRRVKEFLMRTFIAADPINRPGGSAQTVKEAFDEALSRIDTEVTDDPKLQVDLLDDFGEVLANQGRFDESTALFDRALALAETLYPADDPVIAETLVNQAVVNGIVGNTLLGIPAAERAVEILRKHQQSQPMKYAGALSTLMTVRATQGRATESLALAREALELTRQHGDPRTDQLVAALNNVAGALQGLDRHAEAEPFAREAVLEAERLWGPDAPRLADVLAQLQVIVYQLGRYDEEAQIAERRVRVARAAFGDRHPMTASALSDLATIEQNLGRFDIAREHIDTAIDVMNETDDESLALALRIRALFRRSRGDAAGALADFDAGMSQCLRRMPDHVVCQVLRANRAEQLGRMGRGAEALRESDAVLAELERMQRENGHEYAQALESRAFALAAVGREDEARDQQQRAIERNVTIFGEDHAEVQRARENMQRLGKIAGGE